MEQTKIKVLIPYHKPWGLLESDGVFVPIHCGRDVALEDTKDGKLDEGNVAWLTDHMMGDNTGDHISSKNRSHCELTGLYWAWKNYDKLGNPDYIGFMQYRRHFIFREEAFRYDELHDEPKAYKNRHVGFIYPDYQKDFGVTDEMVRKYCSQYDLILPIECDLSLVGVKTAREDFITRIEGTHASDFDIYMNTLKELYPEYYPTMKELAQSHRKRMYQTFIAKKELFFEYCEFLFTMINKLDERIDTSSYSVNGRRTIGYFGEMLFGCFMAKKIADSKIKYKELGITFIDGGAPLTDLDKKTAIVLLCHSDYESLEVGLACYAKFLPKGVKLFLLQNGRQTYDCERTLRVARRFASMYPRQIEVVDWIEPQVPYRAIRELLNSDRMREYEFICKVDDDCFPLTADWFDKLCALYEDQYGRYGCALAYVTSLVNNNPYGFKQLVMRTKLKDEYFDKVAMEHEVGIKWHKYAPHAIIPKTEIYSGANGTVWGYPYIARWVHEKTTLKPDEYIEMARNLPVDYVNAEERYSINCMLFHKWLWNAVYSPTSDYDWDDEHMVHQYCRNNKKVIAADLSIPMVHLYFGSQREENRDMNPRFADCYGKWLGHPYPISVCPNKDYEMESRVRFLETTLLGDRRMVGQVPKSIESEVKAAEAKRSKGFMASIFSQNQRDCMLLAKYRLLAKLRRGKKRAHYIEKIRLLKLCRGK